MLLEVKFQNQIIQNFYTEYTYFDQTLKELEKLDPKQASQVNDIPVNRRK